MIIVLVHMTLKKKHFGIRQLEKDFTPNDFKIFLSKTDRRVLLSKAGCSAFQCRL